MLRLFFSFLFVFLANTAGAQTALKVKMFPGAQSLPVLAAASQGMFANALQRVAR